MKRNSNSHIMPIGLLALLTLLFFAGVLFSRDVFLPIGSDFIDLNFPNDTFSARSLQRGVFPLWNPYVSGGQPFAADPNIGLMYPLRLIFLPFVFSYQWQIYFIVTHYFLAGLFTYFLAIDMGAGKWGSLVAGIGFMFSGFLIGQMDHINIVYSSTWLPLVFLLFRRSILRRQIIYALLAGLTLSLSILAGQQQFSLFIGYWCSLWFVFYFGHKKGKGLLFGILALSLLAIVALLASAVQILPTIEIFQHTKRAVLTISEASIFSIPPIGWSQLLFPHFLGQTHIEGQSLFDVLIFVNEFYMYVGIVILFLALIGSYVWQTWEKWFLVVMVILGFFLSTGAVTPVYRLAFQWVPGMQWVRVPSRFVLWLDFALILLAAFGVEWLLNKMREPEHPLWRDIYVLLGFGVLAGIIYRLLYPLLPVMQVAESHNFAEEINNFRQMDALFLAGIMFGMIVIFKWPTWWKGSIKWIPILLLLLLVVDLFRAQQPRHLTREDVLAGYNHPEILAFLQNDDSFYRVDYTRAASIATSSGRWNPLTGFFYGYPQWDGMIYNPFDLQNYVDYKQLMGFGNQFYDLSSVKYLVAEENEELPENWQLQLDPPSSLALYENKNFMPRAFMVYAALVEPNQEQALKMIREQQYDPSEIVMLAAGEPFTGVLGNSQVDIVDMDNNSLALTVETDEPGYLVVSDTYYPGWQVFVNGQEQEIMRANYAFRAVFLDASQSKILFQYESKPIVWGSVISLITWMLVILTVVGIWWWRKKRVV